MTDKMADKMAEVKVEPKVKSKNKTKAKTPDLQTNYPFVLVHGFSGWGESDLLFKIAPYYGLFTGDARKVFKKMGLEAYVPNVGPFTSAWDRACELYAQIKGGTVDYGKVHSERCGHARYGRTYKKALVPNWGKKGKKYNKINLVGHSYGAPTINILLNLLEEGSKEEIAGTPRKELSELFKGGHRNMVHTVTTLAGTHNGTDLIEAADAFHLKKPIATAILSIISLLGTSPLMKVWDQHMDHYNLSEEYKPGRRIEFKLKKDEISNVLSHPEDVSLYDLGVHATMEATKDFKTFNDIYYFSYAGCKTRKMAVGKRNVPQGMLNPTGLMFAATAFVMGLYNPLKKDQYINDTWYANDGMVSTVSALAPFGAPQTDYDSSAKTKPGVWNKMPVLDLHHNQFSGLGRKKSDYRAFMEEIAKRACDLPDAK